MKTSQHIHRQSFLRINDKEAEKMVLSGIYKYVPKSAWKEIRNYLNQHIAKKK